MQNIKKKIEKLKKNLNLKRTLGLIWSITKGKVIYTVLIMIMESLVFMGSLYVFKLLIDIVALPDRNEKYDLAVLYIIAAGIAAITLVVLSSLASYITQKHAFLISEYVDDKIHSIAIALDLSFYESPAYFNTLNRAKNAGPDRPSAILTNIISIVKNLMTLTVIGIALISINWVLMPLLALFVLPTLYVRLKFADKLYEWQIQKTPTERKSKYLSSLITGEVAAKEIKSFGLGHYIRSMYKNLRIYLLLEDLRINKKGITNEAVTQILAAAGVYSCIAYICLSALNGESSIGDIALFLIVFPQLFGIMQGLSGEISSLYKNNIFLSYLYDLFDLENKMKDPQKPVLISQNSPDLTLKNVHFCYPHANKTVLKNINLKIPAGKVVALVGLNGSGKTTLIKLLCRLYDPTSGAIKLGGENIKNFKTDDYRKQISVVFQDFVKFNMSVTENIQFGNIHEEADHDFIKDSAIKSGAHEYIKEFPDGYNTTMGRIFDNGREVSIGQWQKLAIARALYSKSQFIIFDEATSALDAKSEQEIFDDLREHIGNRGILVISHRVSAVKHADYIYVMSEGEIAQEGTHEKLISENGDYAKLFKRKKTIAANKTSENGAE
ncbi:ABC transporter ATP-binding protein [Hwangdonia lutea]|uniref:ABC transporter ATP-binding protein n=1 Tax=Hwangdonia lutea TaxID=3075823 RepID=A0AA97ELZ3_9FLAO|nr:ABC transporter ATP-binding protein [Hwangdonia sp. SCSIO 19198]WOD43416.1 ABC transporter ATP-binding protein [Hwangdonia sp. SCSIO 19198]